MLLPQTLQNRKPFLASKTTFSRKKSTNHEVSQTRLLIVAVLGMFFFRSRTSTSEQQTAVTGEPSTVIRPH
jgi:hypothetical protein